MRSSRDGRLGLFVSIPIRIAYYALLNLPFELQGAFGARVSGYASEPPNYVITTVPQSNFGAARSRDITYGIRFPQSRS